MSKHPDAAATTDKEALSNPTRESDDALSLELLRNFLRLTQQDRLEVIHFVSRLASSPRQDDTQAPGFGSNNRA